MRFILETGYEKLPTNFGSVTQKPVRYGQQDGGRTVAVMDVEEQALRRAVLSRSGCYGAVGASTLRVGQAVTFQVVEEE